MIVKGLVHMQCHFSAYKYFLQACVVPWPWKMIDMTSEVEVVSCRGCRGQGETVSCKDMREAAGISRKDPASLPQGNCGDVAS
jgi:hypothetical protein